MIMLRKNSVHILIFLFLVLFLGPRTCRAAGHGFARTSGNHFTVDGHAIYLNGFNAYWMMFMASSPHTKVEVTNTFQIASRYGMNIARTWAFSDGGANPLQSSPGVYNENMFKVYIYIILRQRKNLDLFYFLSIIAL